jgi:hypothetical protein
MARRDASICFLEKSSCLYQHGAPQCLVAIV